VSSVAITRAVSAERRRLLSPEPQVYVMCCASSTAVLLLLVPLIYWGEMGRSSSYANDLARFSVLFGYF